MEYKEEYKSYASKIEQMQHNIDLLDHRLAVFQKQSREHEAIFNESQQVLDEDKKLFSDPQKHQEELNKIDAQVAALLAKFHRVQQKIGNLTEGRDKHCENTQEESLKDLIAEQGLLREQMQRVSITPTDKVYIQYKKHLKAYQDMEAIHNKILTISSPGMTTGAQESSTASLSEITQLLNKVQQTQTEVGSSSWCSSK